MITHLRMANETKASKPMLILALFASSVAIHLFACSTLNTAPQIFVILVATIILAWVAEAISRDISERKLEVTEPLVD